MEIAKTSLDDGKAEGIVVIPLIGKTSIADYMIIASGRSNRQVAALTMNLADKLKEGGAKGITIEGMPRADWVLLDAKDIIVHIFRPEVRSFYNLEKMWGVELPPEVLVAGYSVDSDGLTDAEAEEDWDEEAGESQRF